MPHKLATILFLCLSCSSYFVNAQKENPVSNQEIRDAMLSLIHSYSLLDNKLERHEQRERALGELIKKGLMTLQKNQRGFEPVKGSFERLDKRVGEIESLLIEQEDRLHQQQSKLGETLDGILKLFENNVSGVVRERGSDLDSEDEFDLGKKIADLNDNVKNLRREIAEMKADQNAVEASKKNLDITSNSLEQEDYIANFKLEMKSNTDQLKQFFSDLTNDTLIAIEDMRHEVLTASDKSFAKTAARIKDSNEAIIDVAKNLAETTQNAESFYSDAQKGLSDLKKEISDLNKLEKILLDNSNNIIETKRRFEYGIHQIVLEIGDVVRTNTKELNKTILNKLVEIDRVILDNHIGALTNLTSKIETEMSQVWRQIGIMYQEVSSSKQALDRMQQQSEVYVNGTMLTMDSMEGKVSLITARMLEVDENLNFLLGRLSMVTQEFNQIKIGLGDALDKIKSSFMTVQENFKENVGPGPHAISENSIDPKKLIKRSLRPFRLTNRT